jgi:hypothetical protein
VAPRLLLTLAEPLPAALLLVPLLPVAVAEPLPVPVALVVPKSPLREAVPVSLALALLPLTP